MKDLTYPIIRFSLSSLKDWRNEAFITELLQSINKFGRDFIPQNYDRFQPLKRKYNPEDISEVVDLFMNRETLACIQDSSIPSIDGSLLMEKRRGHKISYNISLRKSNIVGFNSFSMRIDINFLLKSQTNFRTALELFKEIISITEPIRGIIVNENIPGAFGEAENLRVIHPELHWINLFGKPYIELFGRDKLLSAPCYHVEELNKDVIALQLTENPFEPIPEEDRRLVKQHLGEEAFVSDGFTYRYYEIEKKKTKVPDFDFSEVMFDSNLPIEQLKITNMYNK
ncbi:hypothetical protein GC098_23215 [Paenibacillus sp. LMG 31458]|uniref:DUF4238 domain-containing protein n=1 Tax=Paenibacillus phytorum TaxID=2654977 RepID=A0ABX1Y2Z7_9BACL|nr:hypothetical protein [Paenibacillus phytorum]NOU74269.1 hypothetical protein [Paenibacillus phytorum]